MLSQIKNQLSEYNKLLESIKSLDSCIQMSKSIIIRNRKHQSKSNKSEEELNLNILKYTKKSTIASNKKDELKNLIINFCEVNLNLEIIRKSSKNVFLVQNNVEYVLLKEFEHLLIKGTLIEQNEQVILNIKLRKLYLSDEEKVGAEKLYLHSFKNEFIFEKIGIDSNSLNELTEEQLNKINFFRGEINCAIYSKRENLFRLAYRALFFQESFKETLYYASQYSNSWEKAYYLEYIDNEFKTTFKS